MGKANSIQKRPRRARRSGSRSLTARDYRPVQYSSAYREWKRRTILENGGKIKQEVPDAR